MLWLESLPRGVFLLNMKKEKYTRQETNIFFAGLIGGIVGGALANFLITSLFRFSDNFNKYNGFMFITSTLLFFGYLIFLKKQIKPTK